MELILRELDAETNSIISQVTFEVERLKNSEWSSDILVNKVIYLTAVETAQFKDEYSLSTCHAGLESCLSQTQPVDDYPYTIHTNRELLMMLQGEKPLAVFTKTSLDTYDWPYFWAEQKFEKYIVSGQIIQSFESLESNSASKDITIEYCFFTLPGEEWRAKAYFLLIRTLHSYGWNDHLERLEGTLLGYTDEQNDIHLQLKAKRSLTVES